jgi:prolyl oligopeptidase
MQLRPPRSLLLLAMLSATSLSAATTPAPAPADDPYFWLEEVDGAKPLAWVEAQNKKSLAELTSAPGYQALYDRLLAINNSRARIPAVVKRGDYYYNFWQDAKNVRGVWRRTTPAEYRKESPAWETVLDLDALALSEKENWVWKNAHALYPKYDRVLLSLSRGGGDATVIREFDLPTKSFVTDSPFNLAEAKSDVAWIDRDTLFVGTDSGAGSLTDSGYPRIVKKWRRGTPLADAPVVFSGETSDVAVSAYVDDEPGFHREFIRRAITFYTSETYLHESGGKLTKLDIPLDAQPGTYHSQITIDLRSAWNVGGKTYPTGALIAMDYTRFLKGERDFSLLFTPGPRTSLAGTSATKNHLIVNELENVRNRLYTLTLRTDGGWQRTALPAPAFGTVTATAVDGDESDDFFLSVTDFLTPSSLYFGTIGSADRPLLKQLPAFFNAAGLEISQHEAVSKDGTHVPYFQVSRKGVALDGNNPTLLYGYGGFEISMTPAYSGGIGAAWLEQGGVYILANIRGGGEFGPSWHQAALKANRQRAYDDFAAIAENLITRKVTSPAHLGIMGGSNGGLLMGVLLTQRPELFGAVVCQVPLLDMKRYHLLLAGASWMGEYGNPDVPAEWDFISRYSPYQNAVADKKYPRTLFMTSTRDDRVHPGHARKMAAKLEAQGHDLLYYENTEGGHGGATNNEQRARMTALAFTFLLKQLK